MPLRASFAAGNFVTSTHMHKSSCCRELSVVLLSSWLASSCCLPVAISLEFKSCLFAHHQLVTQPLSLQVG